MTKNQKTLFRVWLIVGAAIAAALAFLIADRMQRRPLTTDSRGIDVALCQPTTGAARPCAMQTARCSFVVSADDRQETLVASVQCLDPEYSSPCLPSFAKLRKAIARDTGFVITCQDSST